MRISKRQLKRIIKEELKEVMNFDYGSPEDLPTGAFGAEDPDVITFNDEEGVIEYVGAMKYEFKKIGLAVVDVSAALRTFPGSLVELMDSIMESVQRTWSGPKRGRSYKDEVAEKVAAELGLK